MAISTSFKSVQDLKVIIGREGVLGDGALHSSGVWYQLPMIAPPTINENQVALDLGGQQTGQFIPNHNQMKQRLDNPMWEINLQFLGVDNYPLMNYLSHNSSTTKSQLPSQYAPPDWTNGQAEGALADWISTVIYIGGGSSNTTNNDQRYAGCVLKDWSISHSLDSNGGYPVISCTFVTGYTFGLVDTVTDGTLGGGTSGSGWTNLAGTAGVHFTSLSCLAGAWIGESVGYSNYDTRAFGYNISLSRDIQRVGFLDTSAYEPYSYKQVGGLTVEGDVTIKADLNSQDIGAFLRNDSMGGFQFKYSTGYEVWFNGIMSDMSNDTGSPEIRNTISFQGAGNPLNAGVISTTSEDTPDTTFQCSQSHGLSVGQAVVIAGTTSYDTALAKVTGLYSNPKWFKTAQTWVDARSGTWTLHNQSDAIVSIDI